ncbi:MAG: hypothetical protein Q8O76_14635 [Chloroflexota bacterium]|nr:hypothetical protein [Chloroflexota bacterium]
MGRPWWYEGYWEKKKPRRRLRLPWRPFLPILALLLLAAALVLWRRLT